MNKDEVIRKILDAATTGKHSDAVKVLDEYAKNVAIGFAEWVDNNYWFQHDDTKLWWNSANLESPENITTEQLYSLYLQSLNK